jgi:hypothetical protein
MESLVRYSLHMRDSLRLIDKYSEEKSRAVAIPSGITM